jgi:hypothetical protein
MRKAISTILALALAPVTATSAPIIEGMEEEARLGTLLMACIRDSRCDKGLEHCVMHKRNELGTCLLLVDQCVREYGSIAECMNMLEAIRSLGKP